MNTHTFRPGTHELCPHRTSPFQSGSFDLPASWAWHPPPIISHFSDSQFVSLLSCTWFVNIVLAATLRWRFVGTALFKSPPLNLRYRKHHIRQSRCKQPYGISGTWAGSNVTTNRNATQGISDSQGWNLARKGSCQAPCKFQNSQLPTHEWQLPDELYFESPTDICGHK